MTTHPEIPASQIISLDTLKMLGDPLRAKLLNLFASAPATIQELARQLDIPVTRLYYHVHKLEQHNLIQVIDSHQVGGTIEKVYFAKARQFIISRDELTGTGDEALSKVDILIDYALTETGKAIRKSVQSGVIDLQQFTPHPQALHIRRGGGRISTAQASQFYQRLSDLVNEFTNTTMEDGEQGEYFLAVAFFPTSFANNKE